MRRDVWRAGLGRFLFEGALGIVLALLADPSERATAIVLALAAAIAAHFAIRTRRAFAAAHLALGAAVVPALVDARLGAIALAAGLGAAIEVAHVDLVERRRLTEHVRSLRVPSSLLVRRLGSVVVMGAIGRVAISVTPFVARPIGLAPFVVGLGAVAMLAAGIGAGPGRPVTRPIDALAFALLVLALVLRP